MKIVYPLFILINIIIAFLPIYYKKRTISTYSFSIASLCIAFWIFTIFMLFESPYNPLLWNRLAFIGPIIFFPSLLIYVSYFPNKKNVLSPLQIGLLIIPTLFLLILSPTEFIVRDRILSTGEEIFNYGHTLFSIFIYTLLTLVFLLGYKKSKSLHGLEKQQLSYFIFSLAITSILPTISNVILPKIGLSQYISFGPLFFTIFTYLTIYSLLKHQLMNISLIINKAFSLTLTLSFFILIYMSSTLLYQAFFGAMITIPFTFFTVCFICITGFLFIPIRIRLQSTADKLFLKGKFNYKKVLMSLTDSLSSCTNITELQHIIENVFSKDIEITPVYFMIAKDFEHTKEISTTFTILNNNNVPSLDLSEKEQSQLKTILSNEKNTLHRKQAFNDTLKDIFKNSSINVIAPLFNQNQRFIGALLLGPKMTQDELNDDDLFFLQALQKQLSLTLYRLKQSRVSAELDIAQNIQNEILPKSPQIPGLDICSYMKSADEVGGDYFDILNYNGYSWIVVGDVAGHGVSSGLTMFMVQSIMTTLLHSNNISSPSELNYLANKILFQTLQRLKDQRPMTIVTLCTKNGKDFAVSGSHDNIFIYRDKTNTVDTISVENFPFGIGLTDMERSMFEEDTFKIEKNDILFIGTDGITEAPKNGDISLGQYSEKRLQDLLLKEAKNPIDTIKNKLIKELNTFTNKNFFDDITFIIARAT